MTAADVPLETASPLDCPPTSELLRAERAGEGHDVDLAARWRTCQLCTSLMSADCARDPWTGRVSPARLSDTLATLEHLLQTEPPAFAADSLARIAAHCTEALDRILRSPRRRLVRSHQILPLHQVRDVDTATVAWLVRQPGRTLQEKLGRNRRVLALLRMPSADLPENRVVRQLARAFDRLLEWRLGHGQSTAGPDAREKQLRALWRLCRERVGAAGLDSVSLQPVGRPNNALLSDLNYRRVWQAWCWLGMHRGDVERAWRESAQRIAEIQMWVLVAELLRRPQVSSEERRVRREAGFGEEGFGIQLLGSGAVQPSGAHSVDLWIAQPDGRGGEAQRSGALMRVSREEADIVIDWRDLTGDPRQPGGPMRIGPPWQRRLRIIPEPVAVQPESLIAFRIMVHFRRDAPRDMGLTLANRQGWAAMAELLADRLLDQTRTSVKPRPERVRAELIGLDPAGVVPRIIAGGESVRSSALLTIADQAPDGLSQPDSTGVAGYPFPALPDGKKWISASALVASLGGVETKSAEDEDRLRAIFDALWARTLDPLPGVRKLALAIPAMGEVARRSFRRAARAGDRFAENYLLDRATAAALGWQSLGEDFARAGIGSGARVLVIDAEAGSLRLATLQAADTGSRKVAPYQGIYWIRDLADEARLEGRDLAGRDVTGQRWMADYLRGALEPAGLLAADQREAVIARLMAQGEAEQLLEGGSLLHIPLPDGKAPDRVLRLASSQEIANRTSQAWCDAYAQWLDNNSHAIAQHLDDCTGGRARDASHWHVLYVGRPFHLQAIRRRLPALWKKVADSGRRRFTHHALPMAHRLVALGCHDFLHRKLQSTAGALPVKSWEDRLIEQYLDTEVSGGVERLQILRRVLVGPGHEFDEPVRDPRTGEARELTLPAGETEYLMPVLSGESKSFRYSARLRPPGFPLAHDLRVTLWVRYRYGEDDYRLFVKPATSLDAPFAETQAEWVSVVNVAPDFASPLAQPDLAKWLDRIAAGLTDLASGIGLTDAEIAAFRASLADVPLPDAWPPEPASDPALAALRMRAVQDWLPFLRRLAELPSTWHGIDRDARAMRGRKCRILAGLVGRCIEPLGIPPSDALMATLEFMLGRHDPREQNHAVRLLGYVLRDPADRRQVEMLSRLVALLQRRWRDARGDRKRQVDAPLKFEYLNPPLRALQRILGTQKDFLHELQVGALTWLSAQALEQMLPVVRAAIPDPRGKEEYLERTFDAFCNICEVLADLLALRGMAQAHPARARLVEAGSDDMYTLAKLIHALGRGFRKLPIRKRRSRLAAEAPDDAADHDLESLAFVLYSLLAGHDPQRLLQFDPGDEEQEED